MIIIGFLLRVFNVTAPIHELMHAILCRYEGIEITKIAWSQIWYAKASVVVTYGGYNLEYWLWFFLSLQKRKISKLFMGLLLGTWLQALFSIDFLVNGPTFWDNHAHAIYYVIYWGVTRGIILTILFWRKSYVFKQQASEQAS